MGIYINGDNMGVNINGDSNVVHSNVVHGDVYYGDERQLPSPPIGLIGFFVVVLILVALVIKFWYIALIAVSVTAVAFGTWLERREKQRAEVEARNQEAALAARAERQNSAYLRGDDQWGVYGNFPPPAGL